MKSVKHIVADLIPRSLTLRCKYVYQLLYRQRNHRKKIETDNPYFMISKEGTHCFFGYYDVSPFNKESDEILYLSLDENKNLVNIHVYKPSNNRDDIVAQSHSWNWQQGIRLRWFPTSSRDIIFNDFVNGDYVAKILNVDTHKEKTLSYPLYDISPDGQFGLSIDFERLGYKRPGYGYTCREYEEQKNLENEGIRVIDLKNDNIIKVITYEQIASCFPQRKKEYRYNYLNHISYSPSGDKFLFFWLNSSKKLHDADLLVYDFKKDELKLVEGNARVSHYVWQDNDTIICTAYNKDNKCSYMKYCLGDCSRTAIMPDDLKEDGHPSMLDGDKMITDTYPDLKGYQKLYIVDMNEKVVKPLLSIYSNCCCEGERRTDLHPRLSYNKDYVCIDVNYKAKRELMVINIK